MERTLRTENLVKSFRGRTVANGATIRLKAGEVVGLLGPNGAGKTTTFYMVLGLLKPDRGRVLLNGEDVTGFPVYKRARRGLGFLQQESSIFRRLTVEQNLMAILEILDLDKEERQQRLESLLQELDLTHLAKSKAYTLSGGERRRVEITRSLVTSPDFMLLEEPFAGIDPIAVADIQSIIARLREKGIGVVVTAHNVRETLQIVDRAYLIYEGQVLVSGTARELASDERAKEIYLGKQFSL